MKRMLVVLLALSLPLAAAAAGKTHMMTDGQDCSECHAEQEKEWLEGKHGLMNVKCVVCHGSPEQNFAPEPAMSRCRGCHGEQVQDVEKKISGRGRTCFLCHDHHTVVVKELARAKTGFHGRGGTK